MEGFHSHLSKKTKIVSATWFSVLPRMKGGQTRTTSALKASNIRRPYPSLSAFRSTPVNMVLHVLSIRQTSVVMLRPWTCVQHYSHQLTKFWWFISFICYDLDILWSKHRDSTIPSIHINPTSQCTWCSSSFGLKFPYFLMLPRRPGRCHGEAAMLRDNHRIWVKSKNLEEFTKMNWNLSGGWGLPYSTTFSIEVAPLVVRSFTQIQSYTMCRHDIPEPVAWNPKNISFPSISLMFKYFYLLTGAFRCHFGPHIHLSRGFGFAVGSRKRMGSCLGRSSHNTVFCQPWAICF